MQGVYNYIPETHRVSSVYSVAAVLYLQFVLHVLLFRMLNMFCTVILALTAVCVQCPIWLFFCSSLISCFPGMLIRYCLSDSEVVPVAPVITGITFAFTFHKHWISIMNYFYFNVFPASFLITFQSAGIATSIDMHVPCLSSRIIYYYYYYYYLCHCRGYLYIDQGFSNFFAGVPLN